MLKHLPRLNTAATLRNAAWFASFAAADFLILAFLYNSDFEDRPRIAASLSVLVCHDAALMAAAYARRKTHLKQVYMSGALGVAVGGWASTWVMQNYRIFYSILAWPL